MTDSNRFMLHRHAVMLIALVLSALFLMTSARADDRRDFFMAIEMDRADLLQKLLKKGVDPNITEPYRGDTGLNVAMHEGSMNAFRVLLDTPGVDLNKRAKNGNTPIMLAAWKSNAPAVKALLEKGARVNQTGWTALHYAAAVGNEDIVKMLLSKKADVNAVAPNKTTPLMMAARGGHAATAKLLLDSGADVKLRNEWDMNAVDFARDNDHSSLEQGLQSRLRKEEAADIMKQ